MRIRNVTASALFSWMATCMGPTAHAESHSLPAQVWVTAVSAPAHIYPHWKGVRSDAQDQWKPNAPWPTVAAHTQIAMLIASNIENTSDADLKSVIEDIKRRHYELALEIGLLVRSTACPSKSEAYGNTWDIPGVLQKIRSNGGDLRYIAMDEPFYYGHKDAGGCHETAEQLAKEVAVSVAQVRKVFPHVQVGDTDVVGASREWITELGEWADAYRAAVGEPLAFFHADIGWSQLAMQNLRPLSEELKRRQVPFGIIYNADSTVQSTLEWTQSAQRHFTEIESVLNVHPDTAIFETWTTYPTRVLPEDQPGTLMSVAKSYVQPGSSLHLTRSGADISGVLNGPDGKPLSEAAVTLTAIDVGAHMAPSARHLTGVVPAGAATAVIGIRAGTEGSCICAGATRVSVGDIHYKESGTDKPPQNVRPGSQPSTFRAVALTPGEAFAPNLKQFPVTAGASYTFDTSIAAPATAENAGYVTLVFLDAAGKGLGREFLWFSPSTQFLATVQTDAHGAFHMQLPHSVDFAKPEFQAYYAGSSSLRPALALLEPLPDSKGK
jgi:hypothetical protein